MQLSSPYIQEIKTVANFGKGTFSTYGYVLKTNNGRIETKTGWVFGENDCFYHGTWVTDTDSGVSIFFPDKNPLTDNYIGNEPKCGYGNMARTSGEGEESILLTF